MYQIYSNTSFKTRRICPPPPTLREAPVKRYPHNAGSKNILHFKALKQLPDYGGLNVLITTGGDLL